LLLTLVKTVQIVIMEITIIVLAIIIIITIIVVAIVTTTKISFKMSKLMFLCHMF